MAYNGKKKIKTFKSKYRPKLVSVKRPEATSIMTVRIVEGKKGCWIVLESIGDAAGFEISYSTKINSGYKTLKTTSLENRFKTYNISKDFYMKARTYRMYGQTKIFSGWSNTRNVGNFFS